MSGVKKTVIGEVNLKYCVTEKMMGDIFITAFDPGYGGSLYWGRPKRPKGSGTSSSWEHLIKKGFVNILEYDFEDEAPITVGDLFKQPESGTEHKFTKEMFIDGFQKWVDFKYERFRKRMDEPINSPDSERFFYMLTDIDAGDADCIIQFGLFGELVYG